MEKDRPLVIHLADEEMAKAVIPIYFLCRKSYSHEVSWMSINGYLRCVAKGHGMTHVCPDCLASEDFDLMLLKHLP